jgi:two-component sensor histidine kinase
MQMRRLKEPNWALQDSFSRIQSMAAIHELLSKEDVGVTTVHEIAKLMAKEADASLTPPGCRYRFHVTGQPIEISSRQATLLAMVINEIVVNAVRHGLQGRSEGDLEIGAQLEAGRVMVTVEDNGAGLPADFQLERGTGLGLSIVRTLVGTDLGGTLEMTTRPAGGTRVVIRFPYQPRPASAPTD